MLTWSFILLPVVRGFNRPITESLMPFTSPPLDIPFAQSTSPHDVHDNHYQLGRPTGLDLQSPSPKSQLLQRRKDASYLSTERRLIPCLERGISPVRQGCKCNV